MSEPADELPEWAKDALAAANAEAEAAPQAGNVVPLRPAGAGGPAASAQPGGLSDYERASKYVAKVPAAGEGQRNKMLYYLGCQLLNLFPALTEGEHKELCVSYARLCSPPLPEREADPTITSAWRSMVARGRVGNKATPSMPRSQRREAPARTDGQGPDDAAEPAGGGAAAKWLDTDLQGELHATRQLAGTARDAAVVELFDRLSYALQGAEPVTRDRVKELVCADLDIGKRAFDQQIKAARLKQAKAERPAGADGPGLSASGDFDWAALAEKYLTAVRDGSWLAV